MQNRTNRKGLIFVVSIVGLFIFAPMKAQLVNVKSILKNIVAPTFPNRNFNVSDFGALNDGVTDSRSSINRAITVCGNQNGGTVIVPSGKYYVAGSIILKSNVNLHLDADAEIIFSSKPQDYSPFVLTVWEGTEMFNYSPFVYAYHVSNVAITGKGTLNGYATKVFATWQPQGSRMQDLIRQIGRASCRERV